MKNILGKSLLLILLCGLFLGGCSTASRLSQPLPMTDKIAIISSIDGNASFISVGPQPGQNHITYRHMDPMHINLAIESAVAQHLVDFGNYNNLFIVPLTRHRILNSPDLIHQDNGVVEISPRYQGYLHQLIRGHGINIIILFVNGTVNPKHLDPNWPGYLHTPTNFGLYKRHVNGYSWVKLYATVHAIVIDTRDWRVIAQVNRHQSRKIHNSHWARPGQQVPDKTTLLLTHRIATELARDSVQSLRMMAVT